MRHSKSTILTLKPSCTVLSFLVTWVVSKRLRSLSTRQALLDVRDSGAFPSHIGNQLANAHAKTGDLYMATDRPEEAAGEYATAVEIRPNFLDLRFKLAEAYMDLDMWVDAYPHLKEILVKNPVFGGARVRLDALLNRMGDTEGARREWELCAEQNPDDCRIKAYLASLDS